MASGCRLEDLSWRTIFALLSICFVPCTALAHNSASVVFVDNPGGEFFRSRSGQDRATWGTEVDAWSARTFAAATAVLLGVSPPIVIDSVTAGKLDNLLQPDPFLRPRSVFSLLLGGASFEMLGANSTALSGAGIDHFQRRNLVPDEPTKQGSSQGVFVSRQGLASHLLRLLAAIPRTAGEEVRVLHVGCQEDSDCGQDCMDEALRSIAESVEGRYRPDSEAGKGVLAVNLPGGGFIEFDMKEKADSTFLKELVCLHRSVEQLVMRQQENSALMSDQPEMIIGTMSAMEVLRQVSGSDSLKVANAGRFLLDSVAQVLKKYLLGYNGKASVQIAFLGDDAGNMEGASMSIVKNWRRELQQVDPAAAQKLVHRAVAWTTGIIVLIGVLLGICCLCYMPITRDTLLYSGAKID